MADIINIAVIMRNVVFFICLLFEQFVSIVV